MSAKGYGTSISQMHSKMNATVGNYMEQLSALASNAMLVNRTCIQAVLLALMQMSADINSFMLNILN